MPTSAATVAQRLDETADLYAVRDGDSYRVRRLRRAATEVRANPTVVDHPAAAADLLGPAAASWVAQLVATGSCDALERIRDELPGGASALLSVSGLGPKRVHSAYRLGLRDPPSLLAALRRGPIAGLPAPEVLLPALEQWVATSHLVPWWTGYQQAERLCEAIGDNICTVGGVGRSDPLVDTVELLLVDHEPPDLSLQAPLGPLPVHWHTATPDRAATQRIWLTGTRMHQRGLSSAARRRGLTWSEHGVCDTSGERLALATEPAVYAALGLANIPAPMRTGTGEVQLAARGPLPRPVRPQQLRGDLHTHSTWSDGHHDIATMARAALAAGLDYLAITDHTQSTAIAGGLSGEQLAAQHSQWPVVEGLTLLRGTECDILADGSLDLPRHVLASLDWVVASIHQGLDLPEHLQTERLCRAIASGVVDCVGHPTGQRLGRRSPMSLDWARVFEDCRAWDVALEINGSPGRMDLSAVLARRAHDAGVRLVLSTDAHAAQQLGEWRPGLAVVHRAGLPADAISNCGAWRHLAERRAARLAR